MCAVIRVISARLARCYCGPYRKLVCGGCIKYDRVLLAAHCPRNILGAAHGFFFFTNPSRVVVPPLHAPIFSRIFGARLRFTRMTLAINSLSLVRCYANRILPWDFRGYPRQPSGVHLFGSRDYTPSSVREFYLCARVSNVGPYTQRPQRFVCDWYRIICLCTPDGV